MVVGGRWEVEALLLPEFCQQVPPCWHKPPPPLLVLRTTVVLLPSQETSSYIPGQEGKGVGAPGP